MSTTTTPPRNTTGPARRPERHAASPLRSWRASWRVALRMAARETRWHRGRSLLVMLMVAIPVALLTFAAMEAARAIDPQREALNRLGSAAAWVSWPGPTVLEQDGVSTVSIASDSQVPAPARPIPGFDPAAGAQANAAAIGALTGGTATPVDSADVTVRVGGRRVRMTALVIDGRVGFGPTAELLSGSWPSRPGEALVTALGIRKGLPESGTFVVDVDGREVTMTITGVGTGITGWGQIPHFITPTHPGGTADGSRAGQGWLITGTRMPFSKVGELSRYGLQVVSAQLVHDPVPPEQLPRLLRDQLVATNNGDPQIYVGGGTLLLIVITLLVAPAFAVSAARQRRTLALAASNGAHPRQLRHTVLAQALVLGVLSAVLGVGLGVLASWAMWRWSMTQGTDIWVSRFVLPWAGLLGIAGCASLSALVAAMLPARRLGRLDIMGVLKGQNTSPPPSRVIPVVGLLVGGLGAVALLWTTITRSDEMTVAVGTLALVVGALGVVPITLVALARVSSRMPVALRMGTRDMARQRARSVPVVAAIVAAVAALTTIAIASASDNEQQRRDYQPLTVTGEGLLYADDDPALRAEEIRLVRQSAPGLVITDTARIESLPSAEAAGPSGPNGSAGSAPAVGPEAGTQRVSVVRPGCTPAQSFWDAASEQAREGESAPTEPPAQARHSPCASIGYMRGSGPSEIGVLPAEALIDRFGLSGSDAAAIRDGGVVIADTAIDRTATRVTLAWGTERMMTDGSGMAEITIGGTTTVPAVVVPWTADTIPLMLTRGMLITPELAATHAWTTAPDLVLVADPDGTITPEVERRIQEALGSDGQFTVERGFVNHHGLLMAVELGIFGLIVLVVTLTSTALSLAESARDDATLAAVGATRRTRRALAAAQSGTVAGVGAVLGLVVGLVPGVAFAFALTRVSYDPLTQTMVDGSHILLIPWPWLAAAVVGVPAMAALLSAVAVRRAPVATHRVD